MKEMTSPAQIINWNTKPEPTWLWHVNCPGCKGGATLTMPDSRLHKIRTFLIGEGEGYVTERKNCDHCGWPGIIKFELDEDDLLVCCITANPNMMTEMASPVPGPSRPQLLPELG